MYEQILGIGILLISGVLIFIASELNGIKKAIKEK